MPKVKKKSAAQKAREATVYNRGRRERNAELKRTARITSELRAQENENRAAAHRIEREDSVFRTQENIKRAASHRLERQDSVFRTREKGKDAEAHTRRRQDPAARITEKRKDAEAHSSRRQNPTIRTPEKKKDAAAHHSRRQDPSIRTAEKEKDAAAHHSRRQDPSIRTPEKEKDAAAHRSRRQDPSIRTAEKEKDAAAHHSRRQDIPIRIAEKRKDAELRHVKRKTARSHFDKLLHEYFVKIQQAPSFPCSCCGGLYYEEYTFLTSVDQLQHKGCREDIVGKVLHVNQAQHRRCSTCRKSILKNRIPRLCLSNGFDFPVIPEVLKDLSPLEERLVSPKLPFLQIRLVGAGRQSVLKGNVVNVDCDLDICAQVLPRPLNETSTVQVQLMRRMKYRQPYMYETIRPKKVYDAARYLVNTKLYGDEGITLSDDWRLHENDDLLNFVCRDSEGAEDSTVDSSSPVKETGNDNNEAGIEYDQNEAEQTGSAETLIFREDPSFLGIRIAPGEGNTPIALHRDINAELLSFPTIYGGVPRKFNVKVSYTDIAKSELRRYDRRACHPTKILYSFKKSYNEKVYQAVQLCLRQRVGPVTAGNVKTPGFVETLLNHDQGYIFKTLRSSPTYWKEKTKKVIAMIRQLGKCTFFITLSAAETKWTELKVMLIKILKGKIVTEDEANKLTTEEVLELIRSDPVTCMRHFDHRYRALLTLLMKPAAGIFHPYKLTDHFSRLEFQMRGSPHSHGLYWIEGAPEYNEEIEDSEKDCVDFIDKFITCERCEEGPMKTLIGYQLHKHSQTCYKKHKKGQQRKCRFGFPKPPMQETRILHPLDNNVDSVDYDAATELFQRIQDRLNDLGRSFSEDVSYDDFLDSLDTTHMEYIYAIRSSIKRPTVFLKRSPNAIFVNGYNDQLLSAWGANIDFQFVLDAYQCAKYCVGYILKSDGGISKLLQETTRDARKGNTSVKDKLKKFANILVNGTEISAQEAVAYVLGIANTNCSRQDIYVNTAPPEERVGILKPRHELEKLDNDSEDVCTKGLIDHYAKRPTELENVCLAEVATSYEYASRAKASRPTEEVDIIGPEELSKTKLMLLDGSGSFRKRSHRKIIRFRHYGKQQDPPNFWREQLMLFVPWRDENVELLSINCEEKAKTVLATIHENARHFYHSIKIDEASITQMFRELETEEREDMKTIVENDADVQADEYEQNVEDVETGQVRVANFRPPQWVEENEYRELMRTLNEKQRKFVLHILHQLKKGETPCFNFLSGGAGVGKTHTLPAIIQSYVRFYSKIPNVHSNQGCVLVTAPTGKAAFNVFGMTLHTAFRLPPTQYGGKLCDLDEATCNSLRTALASTKLFIIDEISMVSVKMLYDIDQRLRQIFASQEDFGGRSILVAGHFRQLPPIAARPVFSTPSHLPLGEVVGNHLWDKFFCMNWIRS